jgi:lysophospholipase L1-like esterase
MTRILRPLGLLLVLVALGCTTPRTATQSRSTDTNSLKWEKDIAAFEARDKTNPPPKGAILFVGSSSIRFWKTLARDFPDKQVINRGFGGSEISDSIAFADRIIFPYQPRMVVLYAGNNDIALGKSPERVIADFKTFLKLMHRKLPQARIAYISIHPNMSRWHLKDKVEVVNQAISEIKDKQLTFINVWPAMLGEDGKPRPELYMPDNLHLNAKGYELWTSIVKPYLE